MTDQTTGRTRSDSVPDSSSDDECVLNGSSDEPILERSYEGIVHPDIRAFLERAAEHRRNSRGSKLRVG